MPKFVLEELQHIADSSDTLRRNRGRRGLDILAQMQKESSTPVEIVDDDVPDVAEVDAKLVALAQARSKAILTNDFNLNRVAELQGIRVLNINSLANAVKPAVLPGEELRVRVIQEGKEAGQGVGFLDDGTMIVVEGGVRYIDKDLDVAVTRVLQTVAGRMIFAQPRLGLVARAMHGDGRHRGCDRRRRGVFAADGRRRQARPRGRRPAAPRLVDRRAGGVGRGRADRRRGRAGARRRGRAKRAGSTLAS